VQAFEVNWLRWLYVMAASGLVIAFALYLGFYRTGLPRRPDEREPEVEEFAADIRVANGRIPGILILLYIAILVFTVAYSLFMWLAQITY
jgi:hypothetical protein